MEAGGKPGWNWLPWAGFALSVIAFLSYFAFFVEFPSTRNFPWANLLLFAIAAGLLAVGMRRAFRRPQSYRGRIAGPILLGLGIALFGFFCFNVFYFLRQLPPSEGAPRVGQRAPDFTLPDKDGNPVTLSKVLEPGAGGADRVNGVILVFYRGYW